MLINLLIQIIITYNVTEKQKNKEIAAEKLEGASDLNDLGDILDYAFYNPAALAAGTSTTTLETSVGFWKASNIMDKIKGKKYSDFKPGDLSLYEHPCLRRNAGRSLVRGIRALSSCAGHKPRASR